MRKTQRNLNRWNNGERALVKCSNAEMVKCRIFFSKNSAVMEKKWRKAAF
jgi:hypothetical protein